MFYKFYKTIHNHYSKFFKIFYFLRYLFSIFLLAFIFYISIPKILDYEKKKVDIKNFLYQNYRFELSNYSSIKYKIFPSPNIYLENVNLVFKNDDNLRAKKMYIFLDIKNIYNQEKFIAKKVFIDQNNMIMKIDDIDHLINFFDKTKLKLEVKNLNIDLTRKGNSILEIKNIDFFNYGFKKNQIKGSIFERKFKIKIDKEKNDLKLKIFDSGISANFKFNNYKKSKPLSGTSKINILNNYFKLDYQIDKNQILINKSKFRNKDLSVSFQNLIRLSPFFEMNLDLKIEKINQKIFKKLNLEKILKNKNIIKKLNSNIKIEYKEKKILQYNLIKEYNSELYFENGRMSESSEIRVSGSVINCKNEVILIEDYPRLFFECNFNVSNNKKFNKYFSISLNDKPFNLTIKGTLNIFRKKINFDKINIKEMKYTANNEDKIFFKKIFEEEILSDGLINIFETQKIKSFLQKII